MEQSERKTGVQRQAPAIQPAAPRGRNGDLYRGGALCRQIEYGVVSVVIVQMDLVARQLARDC